MSYAALSILHQLHREDMDWILDNSELKTVLAKSILLRESAPSDAIYLCPTGYSRSTSVRTPAARRRSTNSVLGSELDQEPLSETHADNIDEADRLLRDGSSSASRDRRHPRSTRRHAILRRFRRRHRDVWGEGGGENGMRESGSVSAARSRARGWADEVQSLRKSAPGSEQQSSLDNLVRFAWLAA